MGLRNGETWGLWRGARGVGGEMGWRGEGRWAGRWGGEVRGGGRGDGVAR